MHHYMTKYQENGTMYVESWIQINLFRICFCFSRKKLALSD